MFGHIIDSIWVNMIQLHLIGLCAVISQNPYLKFIYLLVSSTIVNFYCASYASTVLAELSSSVCLSVCLSVCSSQVEVVQSWLNLGSH